MTFKSVLTWEGDELRSRLLLKSEVQILDLWTEAGQKSNKGVQLQEEAGLVDSGVGCTSGSGHLGSVPGPRSSKEDGPTELVFWLRMKAQQGLVGQSTKTVCSRRHWWTQ